VETFQQNIAAQQTRLDELQTRADQGASRDELAALQGQLDEVKSTGNAEEVQQQLDALKQDMAALHARTADDMQELSQRLERELAVLQTEVKTFKDSMQLLTNSIPQPVSNELNSLREALGQLPKPQELQAIQENVEQLSRQEEVVAAIQQNIADLQSGLDAVSGDVDINAMQEQLKELERMQEGLKGLATESEVKALQEELQQIKEQPAAGDSEEVATLRAEVRQLQEMLEDMASTTNQEQQKQQAELLQHLVGKLDAVADSRTLETRLDQLAHRLETMERSGYERPVPAGASWVDEDADETERVPEKGKRGKRSAPTPGHDWNEDSEDKRVVFL
jgi:DNA repair exonuclease SbcCD ATPase subunit